MQYNGVEDVQFIDIQDNYQLYQIIFSEMATTSMLMDIVDDMKLGEKELMANLNIQGELFFSGEITTLMDLLHIERRNLTVLMMIVSITLFGLCLAFMQSSRMAGIIVGAALITFIASLSIALLMNYFFDSSIFIDLQVMLYAFIFSLTYSTLFELLMYKAYRDEKRSSPVTDAIRNSFTQTGNQIATIGLLLIIIFSSLLFQSDAKLFGLGLIMMINTIFYLLFIQGLLLPGLLSITEKNEHLRIIRKRA